MQARCWLLKRNNCSQKFALYSMDEGISMNKKNLTVNDQVVAKVVMLSLAWAHSLLMAVWLQNSPSPVFLV